MTQPEELRLTEIPLARAGMLIHRLPARVFQALTDRAITTRFWFTRSSGDLTSGATVQWEWEMYGVRKTVSVKEFEQDRLIVADWGSDESPTTFTMRFLPWHDDTYVDVTERGFRGTTDEILAGVLDSTAGWTMVLSALKAYLEHDVVLTLVADKAPPEGLDL
ncbi:MAG: SRPBCC domain-containing protein [Chloroflexota bacterium]|nr:SRPBCC domain-containing protein [Chloroflexota bacterium]